MVYGDFPPKGIHLRELKKLVFMKKLLLLAAFIAVAAVAVVSCNKQDDPAVVSAKAAIVGTWEGPLLGEVVSVTISPDFKISSTNNYTAQITKWYMDNGKVKVELNNSSALGMIVDITGVKMKLIYNSADIKLPTSMDKMLK